MDKESTDRKRKQDGGSSGVSPDLKKHSSNATGKIDSDTSYELEPIPEIDLPTRNIIMNCVTDCFNDRAFISKIFPSMAALSQPLTNAAINDAVTKAVLKLEKGVIKPLEKQNKALTDAIAKHNETIVVKDEIIKAQAELLDQRRDTIAELEKNVKNLANKLDDLEQYGRRCSIRMFKVPQPLDQSCTQSVLKVMNDVTNVPISEDDIERCHNIGRPNAKGNRPIIVKFKFFKFKAAAFNARSRLKNNPDKIFLSEDLTKKNHGVVQKLVELRKMALSTHSGQMTAK